MHIRRGVCLMCLFWIIGFSVYGQSDQSVEAIRERANLGEPEAQNKLGEIYERGEGLYLDDSSLFRLSNALQSPALLRDLKTVKGKRYPTKEAFIDEALV